MKEQIIEILKKHTVVFLCLKVEIADGIDSDSYNDLADELKQLITTEKHCMYCEKELKPNEAIILCKDCTQ